MFDQNPPPMLNTTTRLPLLPEEILGDEILPRLPVKSLSRFKCVSKLWRSLIKSDRFIEIHYRNSAKNPRVIALDPEENGIKVGDSLQSLLDSKEGSNPIKIEPNFTVGLLGCCNGVLCFSDHLGSRFWLWNPATRVSVELPDIRGSGLQKWGFGWDESSGAYKVFAVWLECRFSEVSSGWVYSSNTNSWTKSPAGSVPVFCFTGVFLRENLHWTNWCLPQVECFDLGREEFGRIELPLKDEVVNKGPPWPFPQLGVIGGSLSVLINVFDKSIDVWVMKEYGVKDSWLKILTFPTTTPLLIYSPFNVFGEGPNGEIFVGHGKKLTVYSPKDDTFSTVNNKDPLIEPCIYVESLVSPERVLDATNTTS